MRLLLLLMRLLLPYERLLFLEVVVEEIAAALGEVGIAL